MDARKNILRNKKRCFICLKGGNVARVCFSKISCLRCSGRHHLAVCDFDERRFDSKNIDPEIKKKDNLKSTAMVAGATSSVPNSVMLQTASVKVINHETLQIADARLLFDNCSQLTYISPELRDKLNLKVIGKRDICIRTFGQQSNSETLERVLLLVKGLDGSNINIECYVTNICYPLTGQNINACFEYEHLRGLHLADSNFSNENLSVDILLGADNYWKYFEGDIVKGEDGPVALNTKVGYVLSGCVGSRVGNESSVLISSVLKVASEFVDKDVQLNDQLEKFWNYENVGVEKKNVFDSFSENVKFDEVSQRYEVQLPFKDNHDILPDNYSMCLKRLTSLKNKLRNNSELLHNYNNIVKDQLEKDVIERTADYDCTLGQVHYLPHRPIVRSDKQSTKVRMVFDASAKSVRPSLNDCLYAGPSLTEPLYDVLLRFRCHKYAFIADVEKAFLQISLNPVDRDFVRFIWFNDLSLPHFNHYKALGRILNKLTW